MVKQKWHLVQHNKERFNFEKVLCAMVMNNFLIVFLLCLILSRFSCSCFLGLSTSNRYEANRTRSFLFGNQGKKNVDTTKDEKKKPFVFLIGKPQYNWVTGKTEYSRKERVNWLYKPPGTEKDSVRKDKTTRK